MYRSVGGQKLLLVYISRRNLRTSSQLVCCHNHDCMSRVRLLLVLWRILSQADVSRQHGLETNLTHQPYIPGTLGAFDDRKAVRSWLYIVISPGKLCSISFRAVQQHFYSGGYRVRECSRCTFITPDRKLSYNTRLFIIWNLYIYIYCNIRYPLEDAEGSVASCPQHEVPIHWCKVSKSLHVIVPFGLWSQQTLVRRRS